MASIFDEGKRALVGNFCTFFKTFLISKAKKKTTT